MKVGVLLDDLRTKATELRSMFAICDPARSAALMRALDQLHRRFGQSTLPPQATGLARDWGTRAGRVSHRCASQASEIMPATAA